MRIKYRKVMVGELWNPHDPEPDYHPYRPYRVLDVVPAPPPGYEYQIPYPYVWRYTERGDSIEIKEYYSVPIEWYEKKNS